MKNPKNYKTKIEIIEKVYSLHIKIEYLVLNLSFKCL